MQKMRVLALALGWEDSPGGGNGNPLQYSYLGNPMDRALLLRSQQKWMSKLKGGGGNVLVAQSSLLLMKQQENLHM